MQVYMNSLQKEETELETLLPAGKKHKGNLGEGRGSGGESEDDSSEEDEGDGPGQEAGAAWEQGDIKVGGVRAPSNLGAGRHWVVLGTAPNHDEGGRGCNAMSGWLWRGRLSIGG
jgi:hypothetical protein